MTVLYLPKSFLSDDEIGGIPIETIQEIFMADTTESKFKDDRNSKKKIS